MATTNGHLTEEQINYIVVRYHIQGARITDIYRELTTPRLEGDKKNEFGVTPNLALSKDYFYKRVHNIPKSSIDAMREKWVDDMSDIPLAFKKNRVLKLAELVSTEKDSEKIAKLLDRIQKEVGEDKLLDALSKSGQTVTIGPGLSIGMMKVLAKAVLEDMTEDTDEEEDE